MATESNVQSSEGVRTYRGRTLEEILPQIREELGPDAIILREREGLVGGVGGFFAQRFIEVEARRGEEAVPPRRAGAGIDIYDEDDDDLGLASVAPAPGGEQTLLPPGDRGEDPLDISASRQTPLEPPAQPEARPFVPPELQRERIIPRDRPGGPTAPSRRFETDVFLERLREASQVLPEDDQERDQPVAAVPDAPKAAPELPPQPLVQAPAADEEEPVKAPRPARRTAAERKPRTPQSRPPRAAPRGKTPPRPGPAAPEPGPPAITVDPWTAAMAALVRETEPEPGPPPAAPDAEGASQRPPAPVRRAYEERRQRPGSLRSGLPTEPVTGRPAGPRRTGSAAKPGPDAAIPPVAPVAPLEFRSPRDGLLRNVLSRLFGGRFASSALPKPSPAHALDAAAAGVIAAELTARGAGEAWTHQLIGSAAAHGTALSGGLVSAARAELARRIVPAPPLPSTGAVVAFIGAGGSGKTRCTAALASVYSRASTLGVVVIAVDNPGGGRELKRLLEGDGVPVLSLNSERAAQAVAAYREGGFVIIDTPTTTPTDASAVEGLAATLAPLELDATFVTLPATLGPQAARRALSSFGRLNPAAVAITHADETDQLAVVVEIAIANRIPLAYLHGGTDHRSAISTIDAGALAQQLLAP
jgi:hypothetical protein